MINIAEYQTGKYLPIPSKISAFNNRIGGIPPKDYTVIAAASSVGKTTFADYIFVLPLIAKGYSILYYSLELGRSVKIAQWLSILIYEKERVDISPTSIIGRSNLLTDKELELVNKYLPVLEKLLRNVTIKENLVDIAQLSKDVARCEGDLVIVIDHIALCGEGTKLDIDKVSKKLVSFRNLRNIGSVVIQQFNAELNTAIRNNVKEKEVIPTMMDLGDSKYTFRDCDLMIGGVSPILHDFQSYHGYDMSLFGNITPTWWYIMKSRYYSAMVKTGMYRNTSSPIINVLPDKDSEQFKHLIT